MKAGMILYLGVEGRNADGTQVIPTTWALCGAIEKGANTGEDLSADPTLPVWGQLQEEIEQLREASVTSESFYIGPDEPAGESRPLYWMDTGMEQTPADPEEKTMTGITAVYTGGEVAVGTAVSALTGITVTASCSDGSTEAVTGYTLSGTIGEGSNTVTITYQGKTATFTVTGVAQSGGDIDFSEANVLGSMEVTVKGSDKAIAISYAALQALAVDKIYYYALPVSEYQKKVSVKAFPNANGQSYTLIVNNLTAASAKAGGNDIVTNAYDHFADGGYVVFEIDVAALKTAVQAKIDDGTLSATPDTGIGTQMCAVGTLYLLYNYKEAVN